MTKTTTEDRDGFRITTVDYMEPEDETVKCEHWFVERIPVAIIDERPSGVQNYCVLCGSYLDDKFNPVSTPDWAKTWPSFESAIAETWPINWDWADYYFNTLILACLRQATDVVVGRVLSGKNPVPDDRQELVTPLFQAIQSWYTGNPPLYAAHVDPLFLNNNELRMLGIAQEFADVIIREAAP